MLNKEVVSLESVVKSDPSVEQRVYFVRGLQKRSRALIKGRLFEGSISLIKGSMLYFVATRANTQIGQYHIIMEVRDF